VVESRAAHTSLKPPPLPDLHSLAALAELVGLPLDRLNWWAWVFPRNKCYRRFEIAKRGTGSRSILAPIAPIKAIQRQIATALTRSYRAPAHVHGFTLNRSPLTNATVHVGQRWIFAIDLEDFFPSITARRVRGLFEAWPFEYPEQVARLLARLCCFQDALPQGAPTSPIISNYICRGMDRQLAKLAKDNVCYYSRYADDLTFSTDRRNFPTALAEFDGDKATPSPTLHGLIDNAGFRIAERKTRLQVTFGRQRVTGLIVNEKVNVPRSYLRGLRAVLHIWRRYGPEAAAKSLRRASPDPNWPPGKPFPGLAQVVRGRIIYVGSVRGFTDPAYLKLARKLAERDPHFEFRPASSIRPLRAQLFTEGPTDPPHIRAALRYFHKRGEFSNLTLDIGAEADRESDQKLKLHCEQLRDYGTDSAAVCLFDSDSKVAKEAVGPEGWKAYGPKVVAVGLAAPRGEDPHKARCIELLHPESIRKAKDSEGRRIYLNAEFDPTTSLHRQERCAVPRAGKESLIATEVFEFGRRDNIARQKRAFAYAIEHEQDTFENLNFEGFRPTFERIITALASLETPLD
jgi:RNA-directed DNA polymerase